MNLFQLATFQGLSGFQYLLTFSELQASENKENKYQK